MNDLEVSRIKLLIDGDEGDATLKELQQAAAEVNRELRRMKEAGEEGSEAWKELKRLQSDLKTEIKEFTDAIDLSDASMKELQASHRQLNRELSDMKVGSEEWIAQLEKIGAVDARIQEVRQEMARLKQEALENSDAYKELQARQAALNAELVEAVRNIDLNDASMAQLTAKSKLLNAELNELKIGSEEWIAKMKEIDQVDTHIHRVGEEMDSLRTNTDKVPSSLDRIKEGFASTFAAFSLENLIEEFIQFGKESVSAAAEMSDSMADISKATEMPIEKVEELMAAIEKIDTRTATEDLAAIAKVAGQLGIAKDEVLGFVESVDKAVVALGDEFTGGAEEVASSIGTLQKLFKETKDMAAGEAINDIGSALNALGATGSATAPVVAEFTARMGQLGDLSPQISETMGLGAAFQELGLSAEIASGGLTNILLGASVATADFAKHLGISEAEMKKLINTDPNTFLMKLAESFRGMPTDQVNKQLADLGIKSQEATKVMSLLKDQTDEVAKKQKLASDAMKAGTSLTDEFNKKNDTAAAQLDKMGKEVKSLSVEFGQALIPIVLKAGAGLLTFINTIRAIPGFVSENKTAIGALAVAIVTFNSAAILAEANSLRLAAAEKGRAIVTAAVTAQTYLMNTAMALNPIGLVVTAVALLVAGFATLYNNSVTLRAGVAGTWEALKVGLQVVKDFGLALKNLDFAGAAAIWKTGGTKIADAYSKGYQDKMKSESAKIESDHKAHTDRKVATSKTGAEKSAADAALANKGGLSGQANDHATHLTEEQKRAAEAAKKIADDKRKANQDAIDAATKSSIAAIADEKTRKIAQLKFETDQEKLKIQESLADQKNKLAAYQAADKKYEAGKAAIETEYREKKEKEERETSDKIRKLLIEQIADEHDRKVAELRFQADQAKAEVERTITDDKRKAEAIDLINKKLSSDIQKENDDQRQKEIQKNQEKRDKELAGERQLFDSQFQAAMANADLNFALAKDNANKIYQAKLDRLKAEYNYNRQKLQNEAAEEKARNAELIADSDKRAQADKAIDDRLKAQLKSNDIQYETDKTQLNTEHTAKRKANQQAFFTAVEGLMNGDYKSFMSLLDKKLANEKAKNDKALQDFTQKGQETLETAGQVIGVLQKLNQKYLESQVAKIQKEKTEQLKAWEAQYKAGIINKDEYEKGVEKINKESAEKEKAEKIKAWKRDQALQIAMAVVNGASAALKSLATMGWPLGLIGVAASAVLTGVQIALIKKQQPPTFAKGGKIGQGYTKNAGVLQGGDHANEPGRGGISMIDRATGQEVGEAEGGEPFMILSKNTRKNNGPIIDMLLHSSLHRNGARIFSDGGTLGDYVPRTPSFRTYRDGGVSYDVDDFLDSGSSGGGGDDASTISASNGTEGTGSAAADTAETEAQIEKSQQLMDDIATNTADTVKGLADMQLFLSGTFLNTIKEQNNTLSSAVRLKLDDMIYQLQYNNLILTARVNELIAAEQAGNTQLAKDIRASIGELIGMGAVGNLYLSRIAAKDLSVQTFVNVFNQVNVVAAASNLR